MNLIEAKKQAAMTVDIDELLQDSYLLVVELQQGASGQNSDEVKAHCIKQVEQVRQRLEAAGLAQRSIEHISHAQCALLDETMLKLAKNDAHTRWASEPLQAKFFNRHQAGVFLYEDMRELLREPAPDLHVLTAFQRVLALGFEGKYSDVNDPEREKLLAALTAQVPPLKLRQASTAPGSNRPGVNGLWLRSPLINAAAVTLLLVGIWYGLDQMLDGLVATLLSAEA
ncbi:type VI secretion system protein TssL, short form [Pseudomonas sp. PDM26]|uniref:type VI secretion system protein TssL, short form n=1 Tax=Pseudomonas sp. PDM26 TaxID=2854766 RepID=UPI001C43BB41|nr:type VI secretion system protein TssL, short form [Pseudomonas sp. PDM26]MBV7549590.1 type VI secretion system protein TssL, short form [Pseudomonas sp. PDM26]